MNDYTPADWYRRCYPEGPDHDPRCLATLAAWQPLYNIRPIGQYSRDGGFRKTADGLYVAVRGCYLSTFDDDSLTRLVIAAHRYACRVQVSSHRSGLRIYVHPRDHDADRLYTRHPDLDDLIARCEKVARPPLTRRVDGATNPPVHPR
jgi:hypothetical protein